MEPPSYRGFAAVHEREGRRLPGDAAAGPRATSCAASTTATGSEPGVAPDSDVETFCALRLLIDSWRWAGVPWYLRAGKRLPTTRGRGARAPEAAAAATVQFGWDTASISGALALRLLLFGLMAPFAAALLQRYGLRRTVVAALCLVVLGCLLSMAMTAPWQLWLSWGVLTGIGSGMTALVLGATVANRWFVARRGLVLGMLTAANATGQLVFLPLAAWLAEHEGWRVALMPGAWRLPARRAAVLAVRPRPSRAISACRPMARPRSTPPRPADRQPGAQRLRRAGRGVRQPGLLDPVRHLR